MCSPRRPTVARSAIAGSRTRLIFALATGVITASLLYRRLHVRWWLLSALFFVITASHGLLDALTWGGETIPFFWPLAGRYGNWGLIPVSDICFDFPNPWTSRAIRGELLRIWLPLIVSVLLVEAARRWNRCKAVSQPD